ncbi:hypothetical protein B0H17DRAFT_1135767 [Mycena rosella]|uniref:Secreted protein n=1 Tax=Mycena rosella TaxID=1033263 RepID=A0AAD7DC97_MYCRO|nr:hypothetical protein B0H17DRAFT_1135767 [Mycena rosella]
MRCGSAVLAMSICGFVPAPGIAARIAAGSNPFVLVLFRSTSSVVFCTSAAASAPPPRTNCSSCHRAWKSIVVILFKMRMHEGLSPKRRGSTHTLNSVGRHDVGPIRILRPGTELDSDVAPDATERVPGGFGEIGWRPNALQSKLS